MPATRQKLLQVCEEILGPLVKADGGTLEVVSIEGDEVVLRLAGTCSGCPGVSLTVSHVIEPALRAVLPAVKVTVTSGWAPGRGGQ